MKKHQEKQRRKPIQQRSIQKYNDILDAVARVLSSHGFQSCTMQEISLESGHPYATIYQYFNNKEDIFVAWLERFIDSSLFGLSRIILEKPNAEFETYIEDSVHMALSETIKHQQTLRKLFDNMPMVTSRLIELMEARALLWLREAFGLNVSTSTLTPMEQSLLTTVRAGNGYWLQLALNPQLNINIDIETRNFVALVKALLIRG